MQEVRGSNPVPPHQLSASLEPKSIPIPRLKSKNGKGFPEEGEVGAEGLWFRRAPREAKKNAGKRWCASQRCHNGKEYGDIIINNNKCCCAFWLGIRVPRFWHRQCWPWFHTAGMDQGLSQGKMCKRLSNNPPLDECSLCIFGLSELHFHQSCSS